MTVADHTADRLSTAMCLNCGYSLHALTARRCPECGRRFDPDDPTTYRMPHVGIRHYLSRGWQAVRSPAGQRILLAVVACLLTLVWPLNPNPVSLLSLYYGLATLVVLSIATLERRARITGLPRLLIIVLLLFCTVLNVWVERCPHATYLRIGPTAITVAGKACGNSRSPDTLLCDIYRRLRLHVRT
jgi:hypothetical protein